MFIEKFQTCYFYIGADLERKIYMQDPIMDIYDVESAKINMIVALYKVTRKIFHHPGFCSS